MDIFQEGWYDANPSQRLHTRINRSLSYSLDHELIRNLGLIGLVLVSKQTFEPKFKIGEGHSIDIGASRL